MEKDLTETLDKEFIDAGFTLTFGDPIWGLELKFKGTKVVQSLDGDTRLITMFLNGYKLAKSQTVEA